MLAHLASAAMMIGIGVLLKVQLCEMQVIWFAVRCLGMQVFDLDLIRCTVGKVSTALTSKFTLLHL